MHQVLHQSVFSHQDEGSLHKKGEAYLKKLSILMTLKSWSYKDEIDNDVEELGEDDD